MHPSVPLLIESITYLILILVLFLTKRKQKTVENKIYIILLITSIIGVILDLMGIFAHLTLPDTSFIRWIIVKLYMLYLLTYTFLITIYVLCVGSHIEDKIKLSKNKFMSYLTTAYIVFSFMNFILPFEYYNDGNIVYIYGLNCTFLYTIAGIGILFWISYIFFKRKSIDKRKIFPIILFSILCIPIILIQMIKPELLLVTALASFVVVFMYHTIENPDLQIVETLSKTKTQAESSNNEKEVFLFDMSQRLKMPIKDIETMSENALNSSDSNYIKENLREINTSSKNLSMTINGLLGISASESHNIEIRNNKYNLDLLIKSIIASSKKEIENKGLEFRTNIDATLPKTLYGDSIRLKQIINIILSNAIKYTLKGYIELSINSIKKYNSCRLIITVEDSGIGIESERLYKLLEKQGEMDQTGDNKVDDTKDDLMTAKTLTSLIGGTIIANSDIGKGSKFTIIIDQQIIKDSIDESSSKIVEQYEQTYTNIKKVLIIEDDERKRKVFDKILSKYNLDIEYLTYGVECLKKVRNKENVNLIIMKEELQKLSSYETMRKLNQLDNFNIPVVLIANKKSDLIENYKLYGFSDVINENINSIDVYRIIDKYIENNE